jgi:hypothetical protein
MKRSLKVRQVFFQQHQAIRKTWMKGKLFYNKHREFCFGGIGSRHQVIFKYYFPHYCFRKCGILWHSSFVYFVHCSYFCWLNNLCCRVPFTWDYKSLLCSIEFPIFLLINASGKESL